MWKEEAQNEEPLCQAYHTEAIIVIVSFPIGMIFQLCGGTRRDDDAEIIFNQLKMGADTVVLIYK